MTQYTSYSHSYGETYVHLQFTPKKRRKPLRNPEVTGECRKHFIAIAKDLGIVFVAAEFGPDHVHIFLKDWKNYSIPQLAQRFKGASNHVLRVRFPWLKATVADKSFWTDGYFHETFGSVTAPPRQF